MENWRTFKFLIAMLIKNYIIQDHSITINGEKISKESISYITEFGEETIELYSIRGVVVDKFKNLNSEQLSNSDILKLKELIKNK